MKKSTEKLLELYNNTGFKLSKKIVFSRESEFQGMENKNIYFIRRKKIFLESRIHLKINIDM